MHMYALVSECDDDHARTHRALAHVANAEHLPVGRSLAVVIVGQLRLSMLKMRALLKNWVGICDQVKAKQRSCPNSSRAHYARLLAFSFRVGRLRLHGRCHAIITIPCRAVSVTRPSVLLCPRLPRPAVGRSVAEVWLTAMHSYLPGGHISPMSVCNRHVLSAMF